MAKAPKAITDMLMTAVRTLTSVLNAPAIQAAVTGSVATLSWTPPVPTGQSVIAGYRLYKAALAAGPFTLVTTTGATSFPDTLSGPQFYRVEAFDQFQTGNSSTAVPCSPQIMPTGSVKLTPGHFVASGGTATLGNQLSKFSNEMDDAMGTLIGGQTPDWIIGYRLLYAWSTLDVGPVSFTGNVAGQTSGTLTAPLAESRPNGIYWFNFNGTFRNVTVTGTSAIWSGALPGGTLTTAHAYDTILLDALLTRCKTQYAVPKLLVITIVPQSFSGGTKSATDFGIIPRYLTTNVAKYGAAPDGTSGWWGPPPVNWSATTTYSPGQFATFTNRHQYQCVATALGSAQAPGNASFWTDLNGAYTAAIYRTNVALEYAALGTALGAKYDLDPQFYGIIDQENSAIVGPALNFPPHDGGYSDTAYYNALTTIVYPAWVAAFPHTNVIAENTFMQGSTITQNLGNWMMSNRVAVGSSDTLGHAYHVAHPGAVGRNWGIEAYAGQQAAGSTATVTDRRGFAACMLDIEGPDIDSTINSASIGTTPLDLCQALNQDYQATNAFWCYIPQDPAVTWKGTGTHLVNGVAVANLPVTTVLRDNPITNTDYPGNYPSATLAVPTNFVLARQGGPNNDTAPVSNSNAFAWTGTATQYRLYRRIRTSSFSNNSFSLLTTISSATATSNLSSLSGLTLPSGSNCAYTDTTATNNNVVNLSGPPTVYQYALTSYDGTHESAQVFPDCIIYAGNSNTGGIGNGYGASSTDPNDTTGSPVPGPHDIKVTFSSAGGGYLPYLTPPICQGANNFPNDLEIGMFNWLETDVRVTDSQYLTNALNFGITTRNPDGDAFSWTTHNFWNFCTPVVNGWATMRIALTALTKGICVISGRIVGTGPGTGTLTATATAPNFLDNSSYITGPGVPAGTYTNSVLSVTDANGSGTYTVHGPGLTAGLDTGVVAMTYQCTGFYKTGYQPGSDTNMVIYLNNWKLTTL